jgi:hypothetical protein
MVVASQLNFLIEKKRRREREVEKIWANFTPFCAFAAGGSGYTASGRNPNHSFSKDIPESQSASHPDSCSQLRNPILTHGNAV